MTVMAGRWLGSAGEGSRRWWPEAKEPDGGCFGVERELKEEIKERLIGEGKEN